MAQAQADHHETQCLKAGVTNLKLVDVLLDGDEVVITSLRLLSG